MNYSRHVTKYKRKLLDQHARLSAVDRSDHITCVCNLVNQAIIELQRFIDDRSKSIYTLAAVGRNIFEISLIVEYISTSDKNLRDWVGQRIGDERQVLESIRLLAKPSDDTSWIETYLAKLRKAGDRDAIHEHKYRNPSEYAEMVGRKAEYDKYYRIFSKFTHPSSWSINESKQKLEMESPYYLVFLSKTEHFIVDLMQLVDQYIDRWRKT